MAGHMQPHFKPQLSETLSRTPTEELLALPALTEITDSGAAYAMSKRANHLRVQAASIQRGQRGAPINSINPD